MFVAYLRNDILADAFTGLEYQPNLVNANRIKAKFFENVKSL